MRDGERERGRDRGVDGVASLGQDGGAGVARGRRRADDQPVFRRDTLRRAPRACEARWADASATAMRAATPARSQDSASSSAAAYTRALSFGYRTCHGSSPACMQIWPGEPFPLGATYDGKGTNFRCSPRSRPRSSCACSTTQGNETAHPSAGGDGALLARLLPGREARPAVRLPRPRAVGARAGALVQSRQAAARSVREGDRRRVDVERVDVPVPLRQPRRLEERSRQRRRACRSRWSSTRRSTGKATRRRARRGTRRSSTRRTSRASRSATRSCPSTCAAPTAGWRNPAAVEYLQKLGVTAVELLPVHQFVQDSHAARARPAQLLGLQLDRLLRAAQRVLVVAARAASRCRSSRGWSRRCTAPASR